MKRIQVGKYLTNWGVIGAFVAVFSVIRQSREVPKDWRLALIWVVWLIGLVLAIAGVAKRASDEEYRELNG